MARSSSPAQFAPHFRDHILEVRLGAVPLTNEAVQIVGARRGHGLCRELRGREGEATLGAARKFPGWVVCPRGRRRERSADLSCLGVSERASASRAETP